MCFISLFHCLWIENGWKMDQYQWFLLLYSSIHQWLVSSNFWCNKQNTAPTLTYAHPYLSCFVVLDSVCWNPSFVGWNSSWLRQKSVTSCGKKKKRNRVSLITDSVHWNQRAMIEKGKMLLNMVEYVCGLTASVQMKTDYFWGLIISLTFV